MRQLCFTALFSLIIFSKAFGAQQEIAAPLPGYKLVWSDEFDESALDLTKWDYRTGSRLLSVQKPANVSVSKGMLCIELKKEDIGALHHSAGGIISNKQFTYGYFEARFRCPKSAGWHTAFWTIFYEDSHDRSAGTEKGKANNGQDQEIDICEQDSANNRSYSAGVIDWSHQSGKKSVGFGRKYYTTDGVPDFSADFHIFGCEFTPSTVRFFLDGKLTHETNAAKFPHGPQNVWLTCVAALWGKPKAPSKVDDSNLPAYAEFDWVRVWEKK